MSTIYTLRTIKIDSCKAIDQVKESLENENIQFDSLSNNGIYIDLLRTSSEDNVRIISALNKILNKVQTKFIHSWSTTNLRHQKSVYSLLKSVNT